MMVNMNNKYVSKAEYFYNPYIEMYCVVNTTLAMEDLADLKEMFESPDYLTEVEIPGYITEDYDGPTW